MTLDNVLQYEMSTISGVGPGSVFNTSLKVELNKQSQTPNYIPSILHSIATQNEVSFANLQIFKDSPITLSETLESLAQYLEFGKDIDDFSTFTEELFSKLRNCFEINPQFDKVLFAGFYLYMTEGGRFTRMGRGMLTIGEMWRLLFDNKFDWYDKMLSALELTDGKDIEAISNIFKEFYEE